MRACFLPIAMAAAIACPAFAQLGNPAGTRPLTPEAPPGHPRPDVLDDQDRLFIRLMGAGGEAEVDAAGLAQGRARSDAVKAFARRMANDHGPANERLGGIARQAQVAWPVPLDPDREAERRALQAAPAEGFDVTYLRGQLVDHQKAVQLLEWEIDSGQDVPLQRYAAETLPTVLDHLREVQQLMASVGGAAPSGLAASSRGPQGRP